MAANRKVIALTAASGLLLCAGGCSNDSPEAPQAQSDVGDHINSAVDPTIFERAGGEGNAFIYDSPTELANDRAVVASGTVVGFSDGYEVVERGTAEEGYDIHDYNVVMKVKVDRLYKGAKTGADRAGFLYLTMSRGAEQEGVPDDGGSSTITPVDAFAKAIPSRSPVIVMASPMVIPGTGPATEVIDRQRGVPDGSVLLSGWHPQSMSFATGADGSTGWKRESLTDIESGLDEQF